MSINTKPITEVPVIEELSEGDKLLVNSGGAAKQINASKVGGSGGGSLIYVAPGGTVDGAMALGCFRAKERIDSNLMSYDEFVALMSNGVVALSMSEDGTFEIYLTPMMLMPDGEIKAVQTMFFAGELATGLLVFSDSNVDLGE